MVYSTEKKPIRQKTPVEYCAAPQFELHMAPGVELALANRDYYNVLGVPRGATQDEIKRAYRSLAMRWHPDRNADDPIAEVRFKAINEAYKTLSVPEDRVRYDKLGPLYTADGRPPRPEDVQEAMGTVIGNLFGRKRKKNGEDLRYTLSLELEDIAVNSTREIIVPREVQCETCKGDGAEPTNGKRTCDVCQGSGKASGPWLLRSHCYHCDGRGFLVEQACTNCGGEGRLHRRDTLRVKVPAGVATGQKLKLSGKGNAPRGTGRYGDLFVIVNVTAHDLFRRRGDDLIVDLPLRYSQLVLGDETTVPTLEGSTMIKVQPSTQPGKLLRLKGRGIPRLGRTGRGDLLLQVELEIPTKLGETQADQLKKWSLQLNEETHPRCTAYDSAVRRR